jgi:Ala-tRNA(Pro) deacylase
MEGAPFYLAIMSAARKFNSKQFKKIINCKSIRFASPEEVFKTTGCLPGAVPPFGRIFGVPVWVDRSLSRNASINFNCGLRTHSMSMSYEDWLKVEQPNQHVFSDEEIEKGDVPEIKKAEAANSKEDKKKKRMEAE